MLTCPKCSQSKPATLEFWDAEKAQRVGLRTSRCRECRKAAQRAARERYHAKNPGKRAQFWKSYYDRNTGDLLDAQKRYRQSHKGRQTMRAYEAKKREKHREKLNLYARARRYRMAVSELRELLAAHDGLCAICKEPAELHMDHDHATGKRRGLLCPPCNLGLGHFRDNIETLDAARNYLIQHQEKSNAV